MLVFFDRCIMGEEAAAGVNIVCYRVSGSYNEVCVHYIKSTV